MWKVEQFYAQTWVMFLTGSLKSCAQCFPRAVSPLCPVSWPLLGAPILRDWPIWLAPENRTLTDTSSFKRLTLLLPRAQFCQRKAFQPSVHGEGEQRGVCVCVSACVCVCVCAHMRVCGFVYMWVIARLCLREHMYLCVHVRFVDYVFSCVLFLFSLYWYEHLPLSLLHPPSWWSCSSGSLISWMMYESLVP